MIVMINTFSLSLILIFGFLFGFIFKDIVKELGFQKENNQYYYYILLFLPTLLCFLGFVFAPVFVYGQIKSMDIMDFSVRQDGLFLYLAFSLLVGSFVRLGVEELNSKKH